MELPKPENFMSCNKYTIWGNSITKFHNSYTSGVPCPTEEIKLRMEESTPLSNLTPMMQHVMTSLSVHIT